MTFNKENSHAVTDRLILNPLHNYGGVHLIGFPWLPV